MPVVFRERIPSKPGGARSRTVPDRCLILVVAAWPLLDFDAQAFSWVLARRDHVAVREHPRQCAYCMPASAQAGHRPAVEIEVVCLPFLVTSSLTQTPLRKRSGHAVGGQSRFKTPQGLSLPKITSRHSIGLRRMMHPSLRFRANAEAAASLGD